VVPSSIERSQEGIFAELKSDNALGYVPTRTWVGNQIYLLSVLLAHNLGRELQRIAHRPSRATLEKRPTFWAFERLDTFRRRILQRAGRLIRPQGQPTSVCPPIRLSKRSCCITPTHCKPPEILSQGNIYATIGFK
jgi:hypothetical protein